MKPSSAESSPLRIALLWQPVPFQGQRVLSALYRWADLAPAVMLRQFNPFKPHWQRDVAGPLLEWQPHGVVVRLSDFKRLARLRNLLPGIPMVSTILNPPWLVDSNVLIDIAEAITIARDHFQSRGLSHMALFFGGLPFGAPSRIEPFRTLVPDGHILQIPLHEPQNADGLPARVKKLFTDWLLSLPKPVGIMTFENHVAPILMRHCQEIGLEVPRDVQFIGIDDVDQCLTCEPHLTSLDLPSERIGEVAMETLLRYLCGEKLPAVIQVGGSKLIPRGSTGLAAVGSGRIARAVRTIHAAPAGGLSAARIVRQSGIGQTTFYKQFRSTTGTTPARQLREVRLKKACQMLTETDASITEIAAACGFSGGNYFARFFHQATGQTPSDYREQHRST